MTEHNVILPNDSRDSVAENSNNDVPAAKSKQSRTWQQFKRSRLAIPGGTIVLFFVITALFASVIAPFDPYKIDLLDSLANPSAKHFFGTDELGRDIFSRIVFGARISLLEGLFSVFIAMFIGVPIGIISGYSGGRIDTVLMRLIDILLAFPGVLLAISIISILGPSLVNAMIAVGIYNIPIFARLSRGSTLVIKAEPYIEACRAGGMSNFRILCRHIYPNISAHLYVMATLRVAMSILTAASLSFLGLGAQAPSPEWGAMLSNGRNYLLLAPHLLLFPGIAIILLTLGINLFQDGLRLVLDPKMANR